MDVAHPLGRILIDALAGRHLPVDGRWSRVAPWNPLVEGIVAVTGHAVVALRDDVADEALARLGVDGFGGALDPRVLAALAGPDGWIDVLDAVLLRAGTGAPVPWLVARPDLADHPRARSAASIRTGVEVFGPADGSRSLVTLGKGIGGLRELSVEVEPARRGTGLARALVAGALGLVPATDHVAAAVAPGNTASLRLFLGAGFAPVASVQLLRRLP